MNTLTHIGLTREQAMRAAARFCGARPPMMPSAERLEPPKDQARHHRWGQLQGRALRWVGGPEPVQVSTVAQACGVSVQAARSTLDRLAQKGLVIRVDRGRKGRGFCSLWKASADGRRVLDVGEWPTCPPRYTPTRLNHTGDTRRNQLRSLLRRGPATQQEIEEALGVARQYAAAMLSQFVGRGEAVATMDPIAGCRVWKLVDVTPHRKD